MEHSRIFYIQEDENQGMVSQVHPNRQFLVFNF
jgi:hypothetical protein